MNHKESQQKAELDIFKQSLEVAKAKGGEARRNVARLSGDVRPFDRPDIIVAAEDRKRLVGLEHFQVDHHIGHGKKVESKAAEFSSYAERFRKQYEGSARAGGLTEEAYEGIGELMSRAIREQSNACVDDIDVSLEAGLFGEGRGHVSKLDAYRERMMGIDPSADAQLGLVIEFHTDLRSWFFNDGFQERRIALGEFPISQEAYELLKRASVHVDWIVVAFCPLLGQEVLDAAVIRCSNGMFETSCARQGLRSTPYIGLGKETPFGKQKQQGEVRLCIGEHDADYLIENTSEQIDEIEMFRRAMSGAAEALNYARDGIPFASKTHVQIVYDLVKDALRHKRGSIKPHDAFDEICKMNPSEENLRIKQWDERWNLLFDPVA